MADNEWMCKCGYTICCCQCKTAEVSESAVTGGSDAELVAELWPVFLHWVTEYAGDSDTAAMACYSREDMRYAFTAGYQKAKQG